MSSWIIVVRLLRALVVCVSLLGASSALAAIPASWKDTGFAIDANGMTLRNVFEEFGRVYGVRLSFGLPHDALAKGRLKATDGVEFLDRLAQPYRFRWFIYNETLYVVPRDDNAAVRLQVGQDAVQDAKQALIGIGLFDSRFGWGELPDEGIVIVSGPRAYVDLARSILLPDDRKVALQGRQVMLFRLKYASATDRVITSRGRSETVPGVKTILSNLLFGHGTAEKITDARSSLDVDSFKRSRAAKAERGGAREVGGLFGLSGSRNESSDENVSDWSGKTGHDKDMRPRIEADPTLNAIIIYDNGSKRAMYESLIEQMDVEPQQVEIEALIVDIDRNKLSELGVEWGVRSPGGNVNAIVNAGASESSGTELPLPGSTLMISNVARFYARLKAMEGNGEAHVLATPTVLTLDNVAAVLDLSQTRYVPLLAERYADLANVTAGTMLRVIPRIVQDGGSTRVRLEVDIEDGSLGTGTDASVTRSTISTQAIVDVQQTLVIGGYHAESLTNDKHKVPVLGDMPLFGGLFRSETQSYGARERLFLITPRLVGSSGTLAAKQSRVEERKASSIARASSALDAVRPVEMRDVQAVPVTDGVKGSKMPEPVELPRADASDVDPVATEAPLAAAAPGAAAAEAQKQETGAGAKASLRLSLGLATAQGTGSPATAQPETPATPLQETHSANAPNGANMTATSLDGVIERLGRRYAAPQPVSAARPVNDPDQPYAGLLVGRHRPARAVQP
jgi:type III secretion protein C